MPYAGEIYNAKGYSTETQGAFNHKLNSQLTSQAMRGHKLGIPNLYQDSGRDTVETLSASGLLAHRLEKGPLIFRGGPLIRTSIKETSLLGNVLFVLTAVPVLEPHCTSAESCGGYPMENTSKCTLPWGGGDRRRPSSGSAPMFSYQLTTPCTKSWIRQSQPTWLLIHINLKKWLS